MARRKVLLIGWDAADWKVINPLVDAGLMPTLSRLMEQGVIGNLSTLRPILSPLLWNSVATGKRPEKHGILGFHEPDPEGGIRPITNTSRRVKTLWNILTQQGLRTHVVGWFASHPAEPINGVSVSDLFQRAVGQLGSPWPIPEGAIHPVRLCETLAALRVHPEQIHGNAILPLVPRAAEIDQERDRRIQNIARILAENCSVHNAATWILENEEWDFLAVCYDAIDHLGHGFMMFHPPRLEWVPDDLFELYQHVINGIYRFHDMMLERLLQLAGPDVTVVLVSDHGFYSDHMRPRSMPLEPTGPTVQHRPLGILCMQGEGLRKDELIYGANILDIAPTVLTLFGMPVGEDMDGRALAEAWETTPEIQRIPSWESVPGECGMGARESASSAEGRRAVLQQLIELGYVDPMDESETKQAEHSRRDSRFNLAQAYLDARQPSSAIPLLEELVADFPREFRFRQQLAQAYYQTGRPQEARILLEGVLAEAGEVARPWSAWLIGMILFEEHRVREALDYFLTAEAAQPRFPLLHIRIGETYLALDDLAGAERAFRRALEIDPESAESYHGLARVDLLRGKFAEAADYALVAVGLQHFLPEAHCLLGAALAELGDMDRARTAFQVTLSMAPANQKAKRALQTLASVDALSPVLTGHVRGRNKQAE